MQRSPSQPDLGLEAQVYVALFVATMFSGSLFGKYVPQLLIFQIVLLGWMSVRMPRKRPWARISTAGVVQTALLLMFTAFLGWQVSVAYAPAVTSIYVRRFAIFAVLLVAIPDVEVCRIAIKAAKYYSLLVALSILVMAAGTGERSGGLVGDHHFAGMMMSISCILFLLDYFRDGGNRVDVLGFSLALASLFISGKRMFTLLALLAFVLLALLARKERGSTRAARLIAAGTALLMPLYLLVAPVRLIVARVGLLSLDEYTASSGRNLLWRAALEVFRANEVVGIGFGNFPRYIAENYRIQGLGVNLTHNIYYGLLAETGVVGFGLIVTLMVVSFVQSLRVLQRATASGSPAARYVVTFSVAMQAWFIVYGLTGNGIYDWHEFFFYVSALAMMISARCHLERVRSEDVPTPIAARIA